MMHDRQQEASLVVAASAVAIFALALLVGCRDEAGSIAENDSASNPAAQPAAAERGREVARAFSLVSSSIRPGDSGLMRDAEIRLGFDEAIAAESLGLERSVVLLEVSTGKAVDLAAELDPLDPRQLLLKPHGNRCLPAKAQLELVIAGGGVLGSGLKSVSGRTLPESVDIAFSTGAAFGGFHTLSVTPADGASLWVSDSPTQVTLNFSGAVDTSDLERRLTRVLYRTGVDATDASRWVPLRFRPSSDPRSLTLVSLAPLPAGTYGVRIGGFVSAEIGAESSSWTALFSIKQSEKLFAEVAPSFFVDHAAPPNLARKATISGSGLHDAHALVDGRTAADGGDAAWLRTDGRADASDPKIEFAWPSAVTIKELIIDTDDVRHRRDRRRVLHSYNVMAEVDALAPDGGPMLIEVASKSDALGDHSLVFDPPIRTRRLQLTHCRTLFEGILGAANPVIYELALHGDLLYHERMQVAFTHVIDIGLYDESVAFTNPTYIGATATSADPTERGINVTYFEILSEPGAELELGSPAATPRGMRHSLVLKVTSDGSGRDYDLRGIEFERVSLLD